MGKHNVSGPHIVDVQGIFHPSLKDHTMAEPPPLKNHHHPNSDRQMAIILPSMANIRLWPILDMGYGDI